jgi:cell wall-associated NlpC family hydrolase
MYNRLIGTKFVNGGREVATGLDCWGLAMLVFKQHGIELPDFVVDAFACQTIENTAYEEISERHWEEVYEPQNTDVPLLVLIKNHPVYVNHVGVYIGDGRVIHTDSATGVIISHITERLKQRITGYYRRVNNN